MMKQKEIRTDLIKKIISSDIDRRVITEEIDELHKALMIDGVGYDVAPLNRMTTSFTIQRIKYFAEVHIDGLMIYQTEIETPATLNAKEVYEHLNHIDVLKKKTKELEGLIEEVLYGDDLRGIWSDENSYPIRRKLIKIL